jgi:hypothetical protein
MKCRELTDEFINESVESSVKPKRQLKAIDLLRRSVKSLREDSYDWKLANEIEKYLENN